MKILIVDDKKENLYLLETLLKGSGYEVESASNGAEALEKLKADGFDMIIADILMPVMDGFQFCRKVKADNELKNTPFVFYTATYTNAKDAEFALKLGADKFIRKPIEPDEFIKIIQGIVEDVEKGKVKLKKPAPEEEKEVLKLYSERLVNKLEKKMLDLEREVTERKRAQESLQKAHDELESRVEERTADLKIANEQLQQEIAEHKRTEVALAEAKSAAESANKAKSDFLANMSHELRTPLNAIIGFSEVLEDQTVGEINEKQKKFINNVLTSAHHLLSLINDILDLSKVEAGKLELKLSNVSIKNLLENSLVVIKEKALKHSINLNLDIPLEISELEITADERKLKQIMFNILSNAVKFTPDGGAINVNALCKESEIIISVADTGIGIKPEDQEHIFGKFEQIDSSYSKTNKGTGLGLALTKRLVELHGGNIWVESEGEGKGSTFTFAIPINGKINNSKN